MSKILINKITKTVVYNFNNDAEFTILANGNYQVHADMGGIVEFDPAPGVPKQQRNKDYKIIGCSEELELVENVTLPDDFEVHKYCFENGEFTDNPRWIILSEKQAARRKAEEDEIRSLSPQPYPSWTWNEDDFMWNPPIAYPADYASILKNYTWDEDNQAWVAA